MYSRTTPTIAHPDLDRQNLGSCMECHVGCPEQPQWWWDICFLTYCRCQNHRVLGSNDDDDDDDGSSAQPSHAQHFEPISESDLEPYNMIRCQLSSNCKPSFQLDILNSCIENIFVSHTPACTFHEEASGIFAP